MQDHPAARLEQCVYKAVAEVTGHAPDDLSPDQFLESDLGLDSIKTVELMNAIPPQLPDHLRDPFNSLLAAGTLCSSCKPWESGSR
ncbi:MAG: acyl carrier protein [Methylocaldum sp.]|nr:acyl carrier protein [Methylocaldum sp.]